MPSPRQIQGYQVEQRAKRYLKRRGLLYISQHFHCAYGEIDLIMKDRETLVFVEVRSIESIDSIKQRRLFKTIQSYLHQHQLPHLTDCRLDIVGQDGNKKIYWIQNALEVQY